MLRLLLAASVLAVTLCASDATALDPIVYRIHGNGIETVKAEASRTEPGIELPASLVLSPGDYRFGGHTYRLRAPGLYRFLQMGDRNAQRIVDGGSVHELLAALAWVHIHGTADDGLTRQALETAAGERKIAATCGVISGFAGNILSRRGYKTRVVSTLAAPPYNTYDNGHTLLEVYRNDAEKWVVYDLDNNVFFTSGAQLLSLLELTWAVRSGEYEIVPLAVDGGLALPDRDGQKYDYSFYFEYIAATRQALRDWYARVVRVALLPSDGRYYFSDEELRPAVERYSPSYCFIDHQDFVRRFYQSPNQTP